MMEFIFIVLTANTVLMAIVSAAGLVAEAREKKPKFGLLLLVFAIFALQGVAFAFAAAIVWRPT